MKEKAKKIKIKSALANSNFDLYYTTRLIYILLLYIALLATFIVWIYIEQENFNYIPKLAILGIVVTLISLCNTPFYSIKSRNKFEYLSHINLYEEKIELIYKKENKVRNLIIKKALIKEFIVTANIKTLLPLGLRGGWKTTVNYKLLIMLRSGHNICENDTQDMPALYANYKFIFDFLKYSSEIPNFKLDISTDCNTENLYIPETMKKNIHIADIIKAEIDYFEKFKKHPSIITRAKMELKFSKCSKIYYTILVILLIIFYVFFTILIMDCI